MADVQATLQIEIQYLKDALAVSQKKSNQYAQLGPFEQHQLAIQTDRFPQ